jgi:hypothetical protein
MTRVEAEKVVDAILEGGGFADRDVAEDIIKRLAGVFPEIDWTGLVAANDAALEAEIRK